MWNTVTQGILQLIIMLLLHPYGVYTMISAYLCINIGWLLVWYYFVRREIGLKLLHAVKDILSFAFIATGVMVFTYYITLGITNIYWLLTAKIMIAAILYIGIMWLSRSVTFKESLQYLTQKRK